MGDEDKQAKNESRLKEINGGNFHGTNKFIRAIEKGETGLVMAMLDQGADVHFRTLPRSLGSELVMDVPYALQSTPLHVAAHLGNMKIVELLLKHGADASAKNSAGQTPMDCALLTHTYLETDMKKKHNSKLCLPWTFNKVSRRCFETENIIYLLMSAGGKPALFSLPEKFTAPRPDARASDVPPPPLP